MVEVALNLNSNALQEISVSSRKSASFGWVPSLFSNESRIGVFAVVFDVDVNVDITDSKLEFWVGTASGGICGS